jgi:AraC-like DNA-binding protein
MPLDQQRHALLYLWDLRTLYIGELFELPSMHTAAACYVLGLEKPFRIEDLTTGNCIETRAALVPADGKVNVHSGGQLMANCFLDPFGRDFRALQQDMQDCLGAVWVNSRRERQQLELCVMLHQDMVPAAHAYQSLTLGILPPQTVDYPIDERLRQAVQLIKQDPLSNLSNQALAAQVGMSESQLQRLFRNVVGVPVRRYRLWHRLFVTAGLMASGKSLTDAALAAGFADSPHFSRTFRNMLGMTPSFVFQRHSRLVIEAGGDQLP